MDAHSTARQSGDANSTSCALDIPPTLRLGPRVEHIDVPRDGSIIEVVSEALNQSQVCHNSAYVSL